MTHEGGVRQRGSIAACCATAAASFVPFETDDDETLPRSRQRRWMRAALVVAGAFPAASKRALTSTIRYPLMPTAAPARDTQVRDRSGQTARSTDDFPWPSLTSTR